MFPLLIAAFGFENLVSPAASFFCKQFYKQINGHPIKKSYVRAREATISDQSVSANDKSILMAKSFIKQLPNNFIDLDVNNFCRIISSIEIRNKKVAFGDNFSLSRV